MDGGIHPLEVRVLRRGRRCSGGLTHHSIYEPVGRGRSMHADRRFGNAAAYICMPRCGRLEGPPRPPTGARGASQRSRVGILLCEYNLFTAAVNQRRGQTVEGRPSLKFCPRILTALP